MMGCEGQAVISLLHNRNPSVGLTEADCYLSSPQGLQGMGWVNR